MPRERTHSVGGAAKHKYGFAVTRQLDRSIEIRNKICNLATDSDYLAKDYRCGQCLPSDLTVAMPLWQRHSYVLAFRHFAKRHRLHLRWGLSDSAVRS